MPKHRFTNLIKNHVDTCLMWLIITLFVGWQLNHTGGLRWDYDEGAYLAISQLISQGYSLYGEIFAVHPPLFFYSLLWVFEFPDHVVSFGRATMVGLATVGLIATGLLGQRIGGRWAGFWTVLLLAWHPRFLVYSKVIIGDVPSTSVAMVALWLLWRYSEMPPAATSTDFKLLSVQRSDGIHLLGGSVVLGLAFALKLLPLFLLPLFALLIIHHHYQPLERPRSTARAASRLAQLKLFVRTQSFPIIRDGLIFSIGLCLTLLVILLPFDINGFIQQNLSFRMSGMVVRMSDVPNWLYLVADLFFRYAGYTLLGLTGILVLWQKNRWAAIFSGSWLLIMFIVLANYNPLWPHLLVVWAFPQAILAAVALKAVTHHGLTILQRRPKFNVLNSLLVFSTIVFMLQLPSQTNPNNRYRQAPTSATDQEIITYLTDHVADERFIITDEPLLAVVADKKLIPYLSDLSGVRLQSGLLTETDLISLTQQYHPQAIIFGQEQRLTKNLPGYLKWVKAHYQAYPLAHDGHLLFVE